MSNTIADRIILLVNDLCEGNRSEFARKIELTPAYISKLDKDRERVPSDRTITDICRIFNVNEHWLRTGDGEMFNQLSRSEELFQEFGKLLRISSAEDSTEGEKLKLQLISFLTRLDADSWEALAKIAKKWIAENKKSEEQ